MRLAALSLLVVLATPLAAAAQDLGSARSAYLEADFERARELYRSALESPELDREEAIEALRYLIALDALLGDAEAARAHARSAIALEPSVSAPEGAPEEATEILDAARRERGDATAVLDLAPAEPMVAGAPATVVLSYAGGPRSLVDELRLRCEGEAGEHQATGSMPEVRLGTPETSGELACTGEARTRSGAVLAHVSEVLARTATAEEAPPPSGGVDLGLVLGLTGAAVAVVVAAVVVAVVVSTPSAPTFGSTQVCGAGWPGC